MQSTVRRMLKYCMNYKELIYVHIDRMCTAYIVCLAIHVTMKLYYVHTIVQCICYTVMQWSQDLHKTSRDKNEGLPDDTMLFPADSPLVFAIFWQISSVYLIRTLSNGKGK